jgi:hypothetical protein
MVAMLAAGYLGSAMVGLGAVGLLIAGRSLALLWLFVILLGLCCFRSATSTDFWWLSALRWS